MDSRLLLRPILQDENLTRGLSDPEARILVEWLVEQAEQMESFDDALVSIKIRQLCHKARTIARFVRFWSMGDRPAACQLAATERFCWPLPSMGMDPCELMLHILSWENRQRSATELGVHKLAG